MKSYLISIYIWLFFILSLIILFPVFFLIWLISYPFDRNRGKFHFLTVRWANLYLIVNPWWKLTISGKEKIEPDKTYIIVSNHQSLLDTLVLFQLKCRFKWVSKQELFRIPILGWIMRMNDYIPVVRGDKESADKMLEKCKIELSKKCSILIFPEGTRSPEGQLLKFKEGAFRLALQTNTDILPVLVIGASDALPKNGFLLKKPQHIKIIVLDVISSENFKEKIPETLANEMQNFMQNQMNLYLQNT